MMRSSAVCWSPAAAALATMDGRVEVVPSTRALCSTWRPCGAGVGSEPGVQAMSKLIFTCNLRLHGGTTTVARMDWTPSYFGARKAHVLHEVGDEEAEMTWRLASRLFREEGDYDADAAQLRLRGLHGVERRQLTTEQVLQSPFGLIEELLAEKPWQLLTTCVLLNKTGRAVVDRMLPEFLQICPGPHELLETAPEVLHRLFQSLGLHRKRARMLRRFSEEFIEAAESAQGEKIPLDQVQRFHGVGKYASDAYEIFVLRRVSRVQPTDAYLRWYLEAALNTVEGNDLDAAYQDLWSKNGLFGQGQSLRPDSSPQKRPLVTDYTEAMKLERPKLGSWEAPASTGTSFDWASPIPRRRPSALTA
ncbi:Methyl-CpG-binding domain protein 4-like protein (Protein MBD4-like), partial [Durusdinium trenchii]